MARKRDTDFLMRFGAHLKRLRIDENLSYRGFSARCDIDIKDIKEYEDGKKNPSLLTIKKLALGLKMEPEKLLHFDHGVDFKAGLK